MTRHDAFWRRLFFGAALFNLGAAALLAFGHQMLTRQFGMGPAAEPALYLHIVALAVALFGVGYLLVSRDLSQTAVVVIGAWSKLGVVALFWAYWLAGAATIHLPLLALADVAFAAAFFTFLAQRRGAAH